ncbi:precorrin-3B synthase [Mesorhizobium marinum]|uniref:precorrin-3B synthase n=1 Tax=Mesorhizobium marinum TaxID=3228790 RepID=UPI003466E60F
MIALATETLPAGGFTRRGACPALSAPMKTGDGLLARLNPVAGGLSPAQLAGLCDAAGAHGNGVIEVTARGSVQVRGLTESSAGPFAKTVDALGIAVRTGVPVQTSVLAGLDPGETADPTGLAQAIRAAIADAGLENRLGPKVSVVLDGGGRTALDAVSADVRLMAVDGGAWLVAIAGDATTARPVGFAENAQAACAATLALLSEVAAVGRAARARDVDGTILSSLASGLEGGRPTLPPSGLPAISPTRGETSRGDVAPSSVAPEICGAADDGLISPLVGEMSGRTEGGAKERDFAGSLIGSIELRNKKFALGVALPFGHTSAGLLKTFAEMAQGIGVDDIRPAPKRTLVAVCGTVDQAEKLRATAQALGFATAPDDPRQAISACPGSPDCASGLIPARRIAAEIVGKNSGLLDGSVHLHVSGCAKGCARPASSDLTIVGLPAGTGLVVGGTARDEAVAFADNDAAGRAFATVAASVAAQGLPGETAAQAIKRLGLSALAEAFGRRAT